MGNRIWILTALALAPSVQAHGTHNVQVDGASALSAEQVAAAARSAIATGAPADDTTARNAIEAVRTLYRAQGYTLAQVVSYEWRPDGTLHLTVAEGRIRRILIRGNRRTRESVIRRSLSLQPGDIYHEGALRNDRLRLARLGIFEDVFAAPRSPDAPEGADAQTPPAPPPSDDRDDVGWVDLELRVKELQTGSVAATVGYADSSGLIGFVDLSENNFLGAAQRASLQWQRIGRVIALADGTLAQERPRMAFLLAFSQPILGRRGLGYNASIYNQDTVFLPAFGNTFETIRTYERRRGGRLSVGANLGKSVSLFLTARHDQVGYDPLLTERFFVPADELAGATATVGALGISLQADGRSNADNPREGYLHRFDLEDAGPSLGGDRRFQRVQLDLRQYIGLGPGKRSPVAAFRLLGGTSTGSVPLPEKFFLGGFDLLRGYDLFSLWGSRMALGSAELRLPLGPGLSGALFADVGDAWEAGSAPRTRAGAGVGLRFASPIGPIRFDVAYGDRLQTYISLGQSF